MTNQAANEPGRLVLIVDDDSTTRIIMREVLEGEGFRIEEAADGVLALQAFRRCKPDAVLLDIEMPRKDGLTVCADIRGGDDDGSRVPIIMTTGVEDVSAIHRAYEVGATDFIMKPISWAVLAYRLRYVLRASDAIAEQRKAALMISGLGKVIENSSNEIYILDNESFKFQDVNHSARNNVGYTIEEFADLSICDLLHGTSPAEFTQHLQPLLNGSCNEVDIEVDIKRKDGSRYPVEMHIHSFGYEESVAIALIAQDITDRRLTEKRMRHLAYFDGLTGLPNRRLFTEELELMIKVALRGTHQVAVLFIDLDNFKRINDTLGHTVGDLLLCEIGARLVECVRTSDVVSRRKALEANMTVSRLGGDEFTVVLNNIHQTDEAALIAERILAALAKPMTLNGHELIVTPSIGISMAPLDSDSFEQLLKHADTAMYQAKNAGRNNYQFYDRSMDRSSLERLTLENDLHKAIEADQFELHYQPLIDLTSGAMLDLEVLVRWQHPALGLIFPDQFIELAEEMGTIVQVGEIVLRGACRQFRAWQLAGMDVQHLSVNISSLQIRQPNFTAMVTKVLDEAGLQPDALVLELTEGVLLADVDQNIEILQRLKASGIAIAVDDFGTGYSSLSYLKRFPVDILKIDRSFIGDVTDNHDSAGIVTAIVALARSLNLKIVAEGIETLEQLQFLRDLGVDVGQGYLMSKPLPAAGLVSGLQSGIFSLPILQLVEQAHKKANDSSS